MRALSLVVVAGALWLLLRPSRAGAAPGASGGALVAAVVAGKGWRKPPANLAPLIAAQEDKHGIPRDLLARLLYQESRYNPKARNARSGAQGIAQVMPATARDPGFGVPPLRDAYNAAESIGFAAAYLAAMRRYVGSWSLALAAYNWGPGYVKTRPRTAWPAETVAYVRDITGDVPVSA